MRNLIIIVNYNGVNLLRRNLPSLINNCDDNTDICVVDNASSDESISFLNENFPKVIVISSKKNLGYGGACNLGFKRYPYYNYYIFMNNDISVKEEWIQPLVDVFEKNRAVGMVGPKILYSNQLNGKYLVNSMGLEINSHYIAYDRNDEEVDDEKYNIIEKVDGLCGAVLMISREAFMKIKGFHKKMFLYYEDVDLSLRIRDQGYEIYYCGNSIVYHDHMATTDRLGNFKRNWMNMRNRYVSIGDRLGSMMAIRETIWYLSSWITWKTIHSRKITLKDYMDDK